MTITGWLRRFVPAALVVILPLVPTSALAEIEEKSLAVELYAGGYKPGPNVLEDDPTGGLRVNFTILEHFGITVQAGYFKTENKQQMGLSAGEIDYQSYLLDLSFNGYLAPNSPAVVVLYGGIGGAFVDTTFGTITPSQSLGKLSKDSFTAHAGAGVLIDLSKSFYLRPDVRWRYFDSRIDDEWDAEYTLSIGWKSDY